MDSHGPRRLDIERYFAGELDTKTTEIVAGHLKECSICSSYLKTLDEERRRFLAEHPYSDAEKLRKACEKQPHLLSQIKDYFTPLTRPALDRKSVV
jgi:hypothetical protein